jgi:hypothetical protein
LGIGGHQATVLEGRQQAQRGLGALTVRGLENRGFIGTEGVETTWQETGISGQGVHGVVVR